MNQTYPPGRQDSDQMLGEAILTGPYEGNNRLEWCSCVVNYAELHWWGGPRIAPDLMKIRMREFIFLS